MSRASDLMDIVREDEDPEYGSPENPKYVDGGVVINQEITPGDFKSRTDKLQQITTIRHKRWNTTFNLFKQIHRDEFYMYALMFEPAAFQSGNINPERAQRLKYIGSFNAKDAALKYLTGGNKDFGLDQKKSIDIAGKRETPWTAKELGVGQTYNTRSGTLRSK